MWRHIRKTHLLSTHESSYGYSNVGRRISLAVLMPQTIDSCCHVREWEGANSWNNEGGKGNPYCFSCPINPTSASYASPELRSRFNHIQSHPLPRHFLPSLLSNILRKSLTSCALWHVRGSRKDTKDLIHWLVPLESFKNQSHPAIPCWTNFLSSIDL